MLPLLHQVLFAIFGILAVAVSLKGFRQVYANIRSGSDAVELRFNEPIKRLIYALATTLSQSRVFRKRPLVSFFHSLIMYGFTFYLLVNLIDGLEGYFHLSISSERPLGAIYNLLADLLSLGVLLGVISLSIRRFSARGKKVFSWNERTLLHPKVQERYIPRDSLIVSSFILFHVGSRILGQGFKLIHDSENGQYRDAFQPLASSVAGLLHNLGVTPESALSGFAFGYWGALGSILIFLSYFPYSKHIHLFMAPLKYAVKRFENSGTLPLQQVDLEAEELKMGAKQLSDLEWPRLLDAYACIQCNRCQDVCPGTQTGKALSPAALEINKRMAFNAGDQDLVLLEMAISPEAVWACTTCGACMDVCPVQNEQMLDIIDIRRHQVLVEGDFPQELNMAFRGMERAGNPWGISQDKRMDWAQGLSVPTIDQNPNPDVLYWVGCAAAYDPGAQKVARSFVQLLERAKVNFAVLGKKETCTGDSARRAGNELLFQQLAERNISNLDAANAKLIVATCPHCMNTLRNEYPQLGGNYQVMHHTEYLELLLNDQRLQPTATAGEVTFHDPCYLGRHNGVYDAPRDVLKSMGTAVLELERTREKSFCCGAGGAQFWKEEEEGEMRVSEARFKEIQRRLDQSKEGKTVAVGCPFCKSMLNSSPSKAESTIEVKDVAELLLERVAGKPQQQQQQQQQEQPVATQNRVATVDDQSAVQSEPVQTQETPVSLRDAEQSQQGEIPATPRKKWGAKAEVLTPETAPETAPEIAQNTQPTSGQDSNETPAAQAAPARKKWGAKSSEAATETPSTPPAQEQENRLQDQIQESSAEAGTPRKKWGAKTQTDVGPSEAAPSEPEAQREVLSPQPAENAPVARKKWGGKPEGTQPETPVDSVDSAGSVEREGSEPQGQTASLPGSETAESPVEAPRKKWGGRQKAEVQEGQGNETANPVQLDVAETAQAVDQVAGPSGPPVVEASETGRKKWSGKPKASRPEADTQPDAISPDLIVQQPIETSQEGQALAEGLKDTGDLGPHESQAAPETAPEGRKKWKPRKDQG
ncbi:heterodisulfide reductase-related iron-sulfur binding cluster [Deinococcus roseus]|uniref:Iron-sulfur-binding protein n=1 Tax=Deinococcus roseus TaxID=392414 RepID=A0ABQ2CVL4_9DEIO|nr:heterodisulfide reductase-related iron-sulfur binding cluster [Deinococcus roseus]GGJ18307.1 iron-sulfur-binding protein [Deinococcus roseus]